MSDLVHLTVTDTVAGQPCTVSMPYARELWDGVTDHDREQLRVIARSRYSSWVYEEFGIRLPDARLDALPVAAA